jgi:tRNA threonylcarbamoyladenosine biosynthesis protein TsaB
LLLAVDTSTQWIGLALYDGIQVIAEQIWQTHNHHTVELAPALQGLLKRSQIKPEDLQAMGIAVGPGSFTSLRIGMAVVKGMALALHIPVYGIPTLDVLAAAQPIQDLPLAVIIQAGRKRMAMGRYMVEDGRWKSEGDAEVLNLEELASSFHKPTLVCGELTEEARQVLKRKRKNVILSSPAHSLRRPAFLAEMAWQRWRSGQNDEVTTLSPIYLHVSDPIPD